MSDRLDRLRVKVEAGELLDPIELALLEGAAHASSGPALKVAYAQALINADSIARAVSLLVGLRRDFPTEVPVLLALSRALLAAERWEQAEKALQELLRYSPDDPEALKAMALLAMRRAEMDRARALVKKVLELDPFDGEAQLLDSELGIGKSDAPAVSRDDFVQALVARLSAQSTPHLLQQKQLLVRLGQGCVRRL